MKKILSLIFALVCTVAHAQTFTVQNLAVKGTATAVTPALSDNSTAIPTTAYVRAQLRCANILAYGGVADGVTDNTSAFAQALAAGPSGRACVFFPAGKFAFNSLQSYTLPTSTASVTILGSGQDVTELYFPNAAGGIKITEIAQANSLHLRDLTMTTAQVGASVGLTLVQQASVPNPANTPASDITNVTLRGSDGYDVANYWSYGVSVQAVSNINFYGLIVFGFGNGAFQSAGYGVSLVGGATYHSAVYNFVDCVFQYIGQGIQLANNVEGVAVASSNFTGGQYGIITPAGMSGYDQLTVTGSQFNVSGVGVYENSYIPNTMLMNNLFIQISGGTGIYLSPAALFSIIGNTFNQSSAGSNMTGVVIGGQPSGGGSGVITGNVFDGQTIAVNLISGSGAVNVQSNYYHANTTNVQNNGTGNIVGGGSQ